MGKDFTIFSLDSMATRHELALRAFRTGLFEDVIGKSQELKLRGTSYCVVFDYDSVLWWEEYLRVNMGEMDYRIVSFENVLSSVPSSLQKDLLFHLDILSCDLIISRA